MNRPLACLALLSLFLLGCPGQPQGASSSPAPASPAAPAVVSGTPTSGDFDVACGCSIDSVGHCGEYARVDGHYVELTGELGLGSMPFCGKPGLKAHIEGQLAGDTLQVSAIRLLP